MRTERSVALQSRGITVLHDVFSHGRSFGQRSKDLNQARLDALTHLGVPKAPAWVAAYLQGWWRCRIDLAYRHDLVYGAYVDLGNKGPGEPVFMSTHRDRPDYYANFGLSARIYADRADGGTNQTVGHYWKPELFHDKKPRPFFISAQDYTPATPSPEPLIGDALAETGRMVSDGAHVEEVPRRPCGLMGWAD